MNTAEQARAAWGEPRAVQQTGTVAGIREQWIYAIGERAHYPVWINSYQFLGCLYFDNGVLTTWQK